jgi:hypothetical protein
MRQVGLGRRPETSPLSRPPLLSPSLLSHLKPGKEKWEGGRSSLAQKLPSSPLHCTLRTVWEIGTSPLLLHYCLRLHPTLTHSYHACIIPWTRTPQPPSPVQSPCLPIIMSSPNSFTPAASHLEVSKPRAGPGGHGPRPPVNKMFGPSSQKIQKSY